MITAVFAVVLGIAGTPDAIRSHGPMKDQPAQGKFPELKGPYFGQKPPGLVPEMFAPGLVSTEHHDDGPPAFSPDGKECFFRVNGQFDGANRPGVIFETREENGRWIEPRPAFFTGDDSVGLVRWSRDGRRLFFSSRRPITGTARAAAPNLWVIERAGPGWTEPRHVPLPLGERKLEGFDVAPDGTLFAALRDAAGAGIFQLEFTGSEYQAPRALDLGLAPEISAIVPALSPDGRCLVFNGVGKGPGEIDLRVSFRSPDGTWPPARKIGGSLNMENPRFPGFSPDGKYLFFESQRKPGDPQKRWATEKFRGPQDGGVDVYWIDARALEAAK
jgi:hypothetical protein